MKTQTHGRKIGMRWSMYRRKTIYAIFFNDTISSKLYCELILYRFIRHLNENGIARSYFQQYTAAVHTADICMAVCSMNE